MFRNVAGFQAIYEYPGLAALNATAQEFTTTHATELVTTAAAHGFQTGDRVRLTNAGGALPAGYAAATTYYVIRVSATTLKLAASDADATAGTPVAITGDGTGTHSIVGYENLIGVFFEASAIAVRAGTVGKTDELADTLGIPRTMSFESMQDPSTGFALSLVKWQAAGKGDLFVAPTSIWGSAVGRQAGAAGAITDKGGLRLVSA
jgi:hypothetical protein